VKPKRLLLGDRGLVLEYGDRIDSKTCGRVRLMGVAIEQQNINGIVNIVPTFRSLLIQYDPMVISFQLLNAIVDDLEQKIHDQKLPTGRYYEFPTYYGAPYDLDTDKIATHNSISCKDVIRIFSDTIFEVYMIGYIAAMPYLGGLPECLHTPRLQSPRTRLDAGVVGIGGQQVSVLPVKLPSGFNYIGRCFYDIYDPNHFPPSPFLTGDLIKFTSVSLEAAEACKGRFPEKLDNFL